MSERGGLFSYGRGAGTLLASGDTAVILAEDADAGLAEQLWLLLLAGGSFDRVAEALAEFGLRRLPSLGVAELTDDGVRILVRGKVRARVGDDDVVAESAVTWQERSVPGARTALLSLPGAEPSLWPLLGGVVWAGCVQLGETLRPGEPADLVAPRKDLRPHVPPPTEQPDVPEPPHAEQVAAPTETLSALAAEAAMLATRPSDDGDDYDHMFGATRHATVESAAVRPEDPEPAAPAPVPTPVAPASEPVAVVVPPAAASASLLIDQVPGGFAEHAAAPASPTTPAPGDHDGMTVSRGQLQRLQAEAPLDPHSVLAVLCPQGDPNPPNAQQCRICQRLIADQEPRPVSRPALGWLLFSTGAEARLDRPVIIGRAPRAERVSSDAVPQLVTLASPGHEISRSHVEVRLEGWHVLVRDLGSANGTVVTLPDRPPERLHAGEAVPIVPGTSVSIADEVRFTYMVDR